MNLTGKGGFQERKQHINRKGRPRSFNQIRALAQAIAHEETTDNKGNVMTRIEHVLRKLAASSDPQALRIFLEYSYGKPVDRMELDEVRPKTVLRLFYAHQRPDLIDDTGVVGRNVPLLNGENGEPESESHRW